MCDSLIVLSKSTEYPLCKKQAIQTEYMLTHCLEGIQGPSRACISSSPSATLNLANAKSRYETRLVKPGKEDERSFALLLWTPEKHSSSTWALGLLSWGLQKKKGHAATFGQLWIVSLERVATVRLSEVPLHKSLPCCHSHSCKWWPEPPLLYLHWYTRREN